MKLAFMISIILILPIFAAYFITSPPQISEKSELSENVGVTEPNMELIHRYCVEYYNSDPYFTSNILAYAGYPNGSFKGKLVFNNKHIWLDGYNISGKRAKELGLVENASDDSQLATFNVRQTVKHEMGHILGLEHNLIEEPSVMNAYYGTHRIMFGEKDKEVLNLKYGKASFIKRAKPDPWIKDIMLRKL